MIKSIKIRLIPNQEQELLMFKTIGCSRFAYNFALNRCNELYKEGKVYSMGDVRKEFTDELQRCGINSQKDFAILTNILTQIWSGYSVKEYKNMKGLKKENLR